MTTMHYTDADGTQLQWEAPAPPPAPLDATGALATLLVVEGVLAIDDAANAVGATPDQLIAEAQGWAAAADA